MRFAKTLQNSIYEPWEPCYIDYNKLKRLLREDEAEPNRSSSKTGTHVKEWTEDDESAFVEELINVQLEQVNTFHSETINCLRERTSDCEAKLETYNGSNDSQSAQRADDEDEKNTSESVLHGVLDELNSITEEINRLEKYSRLNYTGFLKAAKKHDRRRGSQYKVRPLLQVRLAALPFNSEDYSPLLYRLSAMYSFVRQRLGGDHRRKSSGPDTKNGGDGYKSHKFWVHPENILEAKTYILRRLPVLVYNPQSAKVVDGSQSDPSITSLYFDNQDFSLYNKKVDKVSDDASLRLRWYGQLKEKPEIVFEKKTIKSDRSSEIRFPIKDKYVQVFIAGNYGMEKSIEKLSARQGSHSGPVAELKSKVDEIQGFIKQFDLQPVLRANYTRTAFQVPGDDRIRISLDTDLTFIREDALDEDRPCRIPEEWHRTDIDNAGMEYPFPGIKKGEIVRFPYALLEIKVKDDRSKRRDEWLSDLMSSHLVKEAPKFSKFVHGVAQLFEDHVNSFPFWLSDLETDIRKDPNDAFREEQEKKAKQAEDDMRVGSLLGTKSASSFSAAVGSPASKQFAASMEKVDNTGMEVTEEQDSDEDADQTLGATVGRASGLRSILPAFSNSKYARAQRRQSVVLPPGVYKPSQLIKDSGDVHVEPKVWLANQRTFIKWQHISVLLASLSLGLYNAAGEDNTVARGLAVVYTLVAAFTGLWGLYIYQVRNRMIRARSGKDFDNVVGPIVVCVGLVVALCLNFGFKYHDATYKEGNNSSPILSSNFSGQPRGANPIPQHAMLQETPWR